MARHTLELGIFRVIFAFCGTLVAQNAATTWEIPSSALPAGPAWPKRNYTVLGGPSHSEPQILLTTS